AHSPADWERVMAVNARGTFNCAHCAVPILREQGRGAIVNTTSGAFWEGTENVAAYAASKAAVFALTLTLHSELERFGVTSNAIAPNATRTRMVESWIEQLVESGSGSEAEVVAEYGIQSPENLAPLAITLCADAGRGISGHVFEVWGDRIHVVSPPTRGAGLEREGKTWSLASLAESLPKLTG
ncbi:MAG: SDR family oxidoreductase, partial [Myxococcales bacterium]|nr:SDR family oxidoreductase [Myxococcales bacterium]